MFGPIFSKCFRTLQMFAKDRSKHPFLHVKLDRSFSGHQYTARETNTIRNKIETFIIFYIDGCQCTTQTFQMFESVWGGHCRKSQVMRVMRDSRSQKYKIVTRAFELIVDELRCISNTVYRPVSPLPFYLFPFALPLRGEFLLEHLFLLMLHWTNVHNKRPLTFLYYNIHTCLG